MGDREAVYVGYGEEIHRHMCSQSDPRSRSARSPVKQLKLWIARSPGRFYHLAHGWAEISDSRSEIPV